MSVPNFHQTVTDLANKYPREFLEAHAGGPNAELFIKIAAYEIHKLEPRFGLNGKRGTDTLSQDALNYKGLGIGHDPTNGLPITVIDIIAGAGGNNPTPTWQVFNDPNNAGHRAPGKWIQPLPVPGYHGSGTPIVVPPPPPSTEPSVINAVQAVENQVKFISEQIANLVDEKKHVVSVLQVCIERLNDVRVALDANAAQGAVASTLVAQSANGIAERLDRGFKVDVKGGYLVGNIKGAIKLDE